MAEEKNNQYFSVENGELLYLGVPLPETGIIKESHTLLEKLMLPGKALNGDDKEYAKRLCWLSYIFCIASQGIDYERPVAFTRRLYYEPLERLTDDGFVHSKAKGFSFQGRLLRLRFV